MWISDISIKFDIFEAAEGACSLVT